MAQTIIKLIDEKAAAAALAVSVRTLQAWRVRGGGPPYVKAGRSVRYNTATLEQWTQDRVQAHTSQAAANP